MAVLVETDYLGKERGTGKVRNIGEQRQKRQQATLLKAVQHATAY